MESSLSVLPLAIWIPAKIIINKRNVKRRNDKYLVQKKKRKGKRKKTKKVHFQQEGLL